MNILPIKTKVFKEGQDLVSFIEDNIPSLEEGSILVVTSKIVALAENRTVNESDKATKERIIKQESEIAIQTKHVWLTVKDGMIMASAGIDESNADGKLILLPENSYKSAEYLYQELRKKYSLQNLGILITDSRTAPFRAGVTGVALGYAGFRGIKDYREQVDIFNRPFKFVQVNIADSLATAAVFEMGEGNEMQPLAIITDIDLEYCEKVDPQELVIPLEDDMYLPLFPELGNK